jgi:putative sterol carrier protein
VTFQETLAVLKEKVASAKLEGTAVYQFCLSGENGGDFYADVVDGKAEINEGTADEPGITISMSDDDFAGLMSGKLNAVGAFMSGKIKVKGDMMLAMKLQNMLS